MVCCYAKVSNGGPACIRGAGAWAAVPDHPLRPQFLSSARLTSPLHRIVTDATDDRNPHSFQGREKNHCIGSVNVPSRSSASVPQPNLKLSRYYYYRSDDCSTYLVAPAQGGLLTFDTHYKMAAFRPTSHVVKVLTRAFVCF